MKLLVFCHEYPPIGGGASSGLYHLARAWVSQGHEVAVVTSAFETEPADSVQDGVRVIRIAAGRRSANRGRVREMLAYLFNASLQVPRWYKRFRPDRTLAFLTIPAAPPAFLMKVLYGVPYAVELRGGDVPGFNPAQLKFFHIAAYPWIRMLWRYASWIVANGQGLKELALLTDPHLSVQVLPNGVNTTVFKPAARPVNSRLQLLFVGRLVDSQKKISELIEALPEISEFLPVELVIVGDGVDRGRLERLSVHLGLCDRVRFEGWLSKSDLIKRYRTADIYVSMSRWEGMPNAVLEAMACGLPVVLSRTAGHQELAVHGESGLFVEMGSRDELISSLRQLLGDPERRERMGRAARQWVETHHSWERLSERHLDILTSPPPRRRSPTPVSRDGR